MTRLGAPNRLNGRRGRLQYEASGGRWQVNVEGVGPKILAAEHLRPTGHCGPKERKNGQFHHLAGLDSDFRETDFGACPLVTGIDDMS